MLELKIVMLDDNHGEWFPEMKDGEFIGWYKVGVARMGVQIPYPDEYKEEIKPTVDAARKGYDSQTYGAETEQAKQVARALENMGG